MGARTPPLAQRAPSATARVACGTRARVKRGFRSIARATVSREARLVIELPQFDDGFLQDVGGLAKDYLV